MTRNTWRKLFSFLSLIFCINLHANTAKQQELQQLSSSSQWKNLLHLQEGLPVLKDPNFILSIDNFSPLNELKATLSLFSKQSSDSCRFVARHHFISSNYPNLQNHKELKCEEYTRFKQQAPADEISLIYASENLTQPSSMMGHTMLSISGTNKKQQETEHAVSYFTNLDSFNIASILWDTLYKGKEGYFVVEPLQTAMEHYLKKEQRNVWRYKLKLSSYQKELIHKHIWELKNVKIPYFFHTQNCATLSQRIIGVAEPSIYPDKNAWVSPIDVIKESSNSNLIDSTRVYPSNEWKIHLLSDFIEKNKNPASKHLEHELDKTFSDFQYERGDIDKKLWLRQQELLDDQSGLQLDISGYKSPTKTPNDSQLRLAYEYNEQDNWLSIGWMPASHSLEDDNRQYFSENELRLSNIAIEANTEANKIRLKHWHLYSIKQYIPRNKLTGGLSGSFAFGFDQFYDTKLTSYLGAYTSAGLGLTHKLSSDLYMYYMLNVGGILGQENADAYIEPELGAYLYEVFNMKTWISYQHRLLSNRTQKIWSIKHSFLNNNDLAAVIDIKHQEIDNDTHLSASIEFRHYY